MKRFCLLYGSEVGVKPERGPWSVGRRFLATSVCDERHHAHWTFSEEDGLDLYSELRGRSRWTKWHYAENLEALHSDAERVLEEIDLEDSRFQN